LAGTIIGSNARGIPASLWARDSLRILALLYFVSGHWLRFA